MNKSTFNISLLILAAFIFSSCTGIMKPMYSEPAAHGTVSNVFEALKELPEPQEEVVAAVYRFRDQTGQYKPSENVASWSTAVTQGATSILMKAMEESKWFIPIEREAISNLLNERQIIQNIRQQHSGPQGAGALPPLLFAGVLLEGGIIGYDTNIITGGMGARYLGIGGSTKYRKDQVTIYLRAVSTQSGRVLKTVHTTKSIISQQLEGGAFLFVDTNKLLEAETGYTYNEPPVMAVTEAIDEAVKQLILEGIEEGIWNAKDENEVIAYREKFDYAKAQEAQLQRDYFGFEDKVGLRKGWAISTDLSMGSIIGNYKNPEINPGVSLQIERLVTPVLSVKLNGTYTNISASQAYSRTVNAGQLMLNTYVLPSHKISPFISAGGGAFLLNKTFEKSDDKIFPFVSAEVGLDYIINNFLGMRISSNYKYILSDKFDGVELGKYNDQHWNVNVGLTFRPKF